MSDYWKNKWEEVKNAPIPSWQQEWNENNKVTVNGVTYTPQELANAGNRSGRDLDDYYYYTQQLAKQAENQAPKVSVSNGKLKISAPQAILDSNLTKQLKDELKTLVGADLNDSNVQSAISILNKELQENFANSAVEQTLGWTPDEYKDYQYAIQTVNTVNPLKSTNKLKWATDGKVLTDDNGKAIMKTPAEWIKYWREKYNADDRYDMYQKSLQSSNPYERTMALVMGAGGSSPVYGFDGLEKLGQLWGNAGNQMKKFPEGTFRTLFGNINQANNIDSDQKNFRLPISAFLKNDITNEEQFDKKVQSIRGKKWEDLSDNEKAFVLIVSHGTTYGTRDALLMSLSRSKLEQLAGLSGFRYSLGQLNEKLQPEIENMDSKTAVASILAYADFDDYKRMHDSYMTWDNWQKEMDADDERLAKNADWAGIAAGAGNFVGTIGRYLWEDAVLRGLTGGISPKSITNPKLAASATVGRGLSMNSVSDILGEKIVSNLASHGISPVSKAGKSILQFSANLVGTIPEDIIQTSVDNILTYNSDENRHIFDLENMSENFKQNLIWMAGFNAAKAGISAIKRYKMLKAAAKLADLDQKVEINGLNPDYDDIKRAFNSGGDLQIDGETVKAVDGDGNEVVLKNTTPDQAEMVRRQYGLSDKMPTADLDYNSMPYKFDGGTEFYKFVEANSPIDGVREKYGSIMAWLGNLSDSEEVTRAKFEQLPKEMKVAIENEQNYKYLKNSGRYDDTTVFVRLNTDFPISARHIDGMYANYLWNSMKQGQPSVATNATTEPTAVEENVKASVEDINKGVKTSGTLQDKLLQKSKEIYDKRAASANKLKDEGMKQSSLKRAGMEKAARDRLITGELTGKERQALADRYNKFFRGKDVIVNGQHAVVIEPSVFGRVKVKFDDGTTKVVDPVNAEAQFTTKEDIDKDIFNKFIKKDIEQQLGVNLDEMSAETDTAPVQPWDNDEVSRYRQYVRRSSESGDEKGVKYYSERLDEVEAKAKKDYFSKKLASGDLKDGEFFDANFYANPESGRFKIYDSGELYRGGKNEASKGDTTFYTPKQWYAETYDSNVVRNRNPLNTFVYNSENAFESVYYKLSDAVHSTDSYKNATKAEQRAIDDMLLKMNGGPKDFSDAVGGGKTSKQSGKGTPIPQPIQDGFRKLGIDAVEVPEWAFGGKDLGDTGIGHQTEVIVLNKDRLTGSQPVVEAETTKAEAESDSVRNWREQIADAEERLKKYTPQTDAKKTIPEMSYEDRKRVAQRVVTDSNGEYILLYRVQGGAPDRWRPNNRGVKGEFKATGGEKGLEGAVWLTADENWAEGPDRASAGVKSEWTGPNGGEEVTNDNIVVIPVKRSDILELNHETGAKEALAKSGKKIVKTRGINNGLEKSEYILWENEHPEVFDDGMELMLEKRNEMAENDPTYKRQARKIQRELDDLETALRAQLNEEAKTKVEAETETAKAEAETPKTTLVGTEDATGRTIEEAPVYNFKNHGDALSAEVKPTKAGVEHWHSNALDATMNEGAQLISDLHAKFGDVEPGDFDWVFQSQKSNIPLDKIVGSTIPGTNRVITQNMIDAMKWWADQPVIKELRQASRAGLGESGDNNTLGYLPHTDYDPSNASYEEAIAGALWKHYTGASMMKDGKYVGYGGTFENRFRTYASNMLWDAKAKDVAASKLVEEAVMDGQQVTPELIANARKVVDKDVNLQKAVNNSPSTRALEKALADVEEKPDFSSIESTAQKEGAKSNLGKAYHDAYADSGVYSNANSKGVKSQATTFQENFDTFGNNMRKIQLEGGMALYDWGGAAIIYADQDAIELVSRYMRDGGDFRQMLVEYIKNHSHRSPEYAEAVADKWMAKIGTIPGELTKGKLISSLAQSMKWEGFARLKKWLAMAKYDELNAASRKTIDSLLFNHLQMNAVKNNKKIGTAITKALDVVTGMRYRALFYGNLKNGLLQVSELGRLFTTFKLGDIAQMAKHMATDADFRARVEMYTDAVAPRTKGLKSALQDARQSLYESYANAAGNMKVESDGVSFGDFYTKFKDSVDNIGLAPIEAAEAYKNHMMVAAIVQEADNLEANGKIKNPTEKMNYIRRRFERVALAADEIGRIGLSSSPLGRFALFLQNFQIRELGMHYYNIKDAILAGTTIPKKVYNVVSYLSKVFGTKMAVTLVLARLGYSATQTLGIDPFGMLDSYSTMDEDEMNFLDEQISHGVLTPLFSGGMTSLIADLYFMGRNAYEDSVRKTVADDAQANLEKDDILDSFKFWERWKLPEDANPLDAALGLAENFAPGATFTKRIGQMNDMMDSGWATSVAGNKQYTAPTDALNIVLGYLFGRNATQNAMQYNQTYGDNLWQTLGRFNPFRSWGEFDPIDTKNYSDWFKGNENDAQQFNKGIYWFRDQRDRILDAYKEAIQRGYSTSEKTEAKNLMNERLGELYTKLERFVKAYEKKNGSITPAMTKQIINLLNTYEDTTNPSQEIDAEQDSLGGYSNAIERYAGLDLPSIGTYTGPTTSEPEKEVSYQGSPQWRAAVSGYRNVDDEVVNVLKLVDKTTLAPLRKELKDAISEAYAKKDWDALGRIQKQYLKAFDNAVGPVVAAYGNSILNKGKVENQLEEMLSSGGNSGNLIPSEQYAKNKYGRYQSMEYESVDVGKWAQKRFSGDTYTKPTITSNSTAAEDLVEIKRLIRRGQNDRARARALQLKVRVDNQQRYLSKDDYNWLNDYINYKEGK